MNDLISVIIPAHNCGAYLWDCVQSLLEQTYPHFEAIVVDDGSEDDTWKICGQIRRQDSRIRIFHQENRGVSEARNRGMELAGGAYLVFLDGDDLLHPLFLEKTLKRAKRTGADVVGCQYFRVPTPEQLHDWFFNRHDSTLDMVTCKLLRRSALCEDGVMQKFKRGLALARIRFSCMIWCRRACAWNLRTRAGICTARTGRARRTGRRSTARRSCWRFTKRCRRRLRRPEIRSTRRKWNGRACPRCAKSIMWPAGGDRRTSVSE